MEIRFSENLKRLRIESKLTQSKLATLLRVDQRTISAWENNVCEPDYTTLAKLCDLFGEDFNGILT